MRYQIPESAVLELFTYFSKFISMKTQLLITSAEEYLDM